LVAERFRRNVFAALHHGTAEPFGGSLSEPRQLKRRLKDRHSDGVIAMDEATTVVSERMIVGGVSGSAGQAAWPVSWWSGLSWGAVIAGAITAIAVTIIVVALGSGIGLSLASPYSYSPSGSTLTIMGAVWLVFAQAIGFAVGGYIAGRLRRDPSALRTAEVKFRDGANGLTVWAIGVAVSTIIIAAAAGKVTNAVENTAGAAASLTASAGQWPSIDYFVDNLLRTSPQPGANGAAAVASNGANAGQSSVAANAANARMQRDQVSRILVTALGPKGLSSNDRTYLARIVSAQTGLSENDAQQRVDDVVSMAKQDATQAVDAARKAAAYLSFWTFMSLLFGAVCATMGGMLGGDLRDEIAMREAVATSPS
jgi:hypothetical protein